jgi:hypothetical protein
MEWFTGARRRLLAAAVLLIGLFVPARVAGAQVVSGTVRDSASGIPIPGTRVLVLEANGRATAQGTTDGSGRFRLSSPPARGRRATGPLRLRVVRMGFRPHEVPLPRVAGEQTIDVAIASFPIVLEEVQVTAASCPQRADRKQALAVLQSARMALYGTVLARSGSSASMTRLLYERRLDPSGRIVSQRVHRRVTTGRGEPFSAARTALAIGRDGFEFDSSGAHTYLGPDADALVDEEFVQHHCFKLMPSDRSRPQQVGLGIEPLEEEDGRIDIVGTLWVDTLSRVLDDLTFKYVGLDKQTAALRPEGRLSFRELPNGIVIVDRWSLRLPGEPARTGSGAVPEIGGEIADASWPDGFDWHAPLGTLRLQVVDAQGRAATGSSVHLVDTDYGGSVDSSGSAVTIGDLLPGPYVASVVDPRLSVLGVAKPTTYRFTAQRDSTREALLTVATAEELVRSRCSQSTSIVAGRGALLGRVVTPDGRPVPNARWAIRDQFGTTLVEDGKVDADGWFQWCQLPLNTRVNIDVWRDERRVNDSRIVMDPLTTLNFILPP